MEGNRYGEVEDGNTAAQQHGGKGIVGFAQPMRDPQQDAAAEQADHHTAHRPDPILVDGIFHKNANADDQDADTDLVQQVPANEVFQAFFGFGCGRLRLGTALNGCHGRNHRRSGCLRRS